MISFMNGKYIAVWHGDILKLTRHDYVAGTEAPVKDCETIRQCCQAVIDIEGEDASDVKKFMDSMGEAADIAAEVLGYKPTKD